MKIVSYKHSVRYGGPLCFRCGSVVNDPLSTTLVVVPSYYLSRVECDEHTTWVHIEEKYFVTCDECTQWQESEYMAMYRDLYNL